MVDNKYMHGERHGAHNGHYLALADGEIAFFDAEEIEADHAERNANPYPRAHLLAEKQPEKRHQKHIKSGYETNLARIEKIKSILLQICADKEGQAATNAAYKHVLERKFFLLAVGKCGIFFLKRHYDKRHEDYCAEQSPKPIECESACFFAACALCNERKPPYHCGENAIKRP